LLGFLSKLHHLAVESMSNLRIDLILGLTRNGELDMEPLDVFICVREPICVVFPDVVWCAQPAARVVVLLLGRVKRWLMFTTQIGQAELLSIAITVRVFGPLCMFESPVTRVSDLDCVSGSCEYLLSNIVPFLEVRIALFREGAEVEHHVVRISERQRLVS
jgi:hypothetical protein